MLKRNNAAMASTETRNRDLSRYRRSASQYEARWQRYLTATHRHALSAVTMKPAAHVLDVASGTGLFLRRLAAIDPTLSLSGVDLTAEMLTQSRLQATGATVVRADMQLLPFYTAAFDTVFCLSALHFAPQPDRALAEMARVCKHDGNVVLVVWRHEDPLMALAQAWARVTARPLTPAIRETTLLSAIQSAGLRVTQTMPFRVGLRWALSCYRLRRMQGTVQPKP